MMKSVVLAASALALVAGLNAARAEGAGVVPPATVANVQHYFVSTCADYLAHPPAERGAVIAWMADYQNQGKAPHGHTRHGFPDTWYAGAPQSELTAACSADPHLAFGSVMENHHVVG